jgi:1,3-beta-glucanosyltransferase GAS1
MPFYSLSQPDACDRDLPYLKQLGVNTVRIYSVDASANHSHCMSALSQAGIYTLYVYRTRPLAYGSSNLGDVHSIDLSLPVNGSISEC